MTLTDAEGNSVSDDMVMTINNTPEPPPMAQGPDYVDLYITTSSVYSTSGIPEISIYSWYLDPSEAGTIQGAGLTSTMTWNPDYLGTAYITVSATGQCGEGDVSAALEVTVDNTVGIGSPENHGLGMEIYPNPGNGLFNIRIFSESSGMMQLKLVNVLGKTVLSRSVKIPRGSDYPLNLENLPEGVYFLNIEGKDQHLTKKVIKK
jgi:hypothetical protein